MCLPVVLKEQQETVEEARVEVVVPAARLAPVVAALRKAHPYEEAAYDIFARCDAPSPAFGMGRVGDLPTPLTQVEHSTSTFADCYAVICGVKLNYCPIYQHACGQVIAVLIANFLSSMSMAEPATVIPAVLQCKQYPSDISSRIGNAQHPWNLIGAKEAKVNLSALDWHAIANLQIK